MATLCKLTCRFKRTMSKLPVSSLSFFAEIDTDHKSAYGNAREEEQSKESWKRGTKLEDSHFLISKLTTKLQSRLDGLGIRTDTQVKWIELRIQKHTHTCVLRAKPLQSCLTLCDPMDCSPPGSMEFSKPEFRGGLPFPSRGDLPHPGIEAVSLLSPELASGFLPLGPLGSPCIHTLVVNWLSTGCYAAVHGVTKSRTWLSNWTELKTIQ